jgi:inosine/xanthosine triphosphatase
MGEAKMKITIGSLNPTKVGAVKNIFKQFVVEGLNVPSNVSDQPMTDHETMQGAINRGHNARIEGNSEIGIGLEGGVIIENERLFLCNWGALVYENEVILASGAKILLPSEFIADLQNGTELAVLMERYTNEKDIRSKEGAVGIFTNGRITRTQIFEHICELLLGQYEFQKQKEDK